MGGNGVVRKIREENIEILRNRSGDLVNNAVIPREVDKWAEKEGFGYSEEGYLVKWNGQYGFLYNEEYSHDKQTDEMERNFALDSGLKSEEVISKLMDIAEKLSEKVEEGIVVMVGEETGALQRHEFCIFFPVGTTGKTYQETLALLEEISR
jgi:hypothetical protein